MPTIKDVAREAGVSIATVSYVLNKKTQSISSETRQAVLEAAERIGYTPNVTARNLRHSRTRLLGYAWHEAPAQQINPVMDQFTYYLAHAAEDHGYHLLTFTHPDDDPAPAYDELIRMRRLDAFVLSAVSAADPRIELLFNRKFPFAAFGRAWAKSEWDFPWVDVDGRQGIYDVVKYLYGLGHRRIAMIAWQDDSSAATYRLRGYQEAMQAFGLTIHEGYIYHGENTEATGRSALRYWYDRHPQERPTAVVAISDTEAIGLMKQAEDNGLTVGSDISVVGFDNVPLSQHLRPALTTLAQPIPEVAEALVKLLLAELENQHLEPRTLLLPPELIVRQSSGPPR